MAKYITKFDSIEAYNAAKESLDYPNISLIEGVGLDWQETAPPTPPHDYGNDYFTFVALEDGTFSFSNSGLSYSLDSGITWQTLEGETSTPTIQNGSTVFWKGELVPPDRGGIGTFSSTGEFDVEGNIMSLVYGDNFIGQTDLTRKDFAFENLFLDCWNLINAENLVLPATTLSEGCYLTMFEGCSSLTTAPQLSATTLAYNCYEMMFYGCTSLTTAPELPATTLVDWCYASMFAECTSLNKITCLATDISASRCTHNWLDFVATSGVFTKAASMNDWTSGDNGVPIGWSVQDYT